MNITDVLAFIRVHGCVNNDPVVSEEELLVIAEMYQTGETSWDRSGAIAEVWMLKAGKASSMYNFSDDAQSFSLSQIRENCEKQAKRWRRRRVGSINTLGDYPISDEVAVVGTVTGDAADGVAIDHEITGITWLDAIQSNELASSIGLSHSITGIVWDNISLSSTIANSIGVGMLPTGIDYEEILLLNSIQNSVGIGHVPTAIDWVSIMLSSDVANSVGVGHAVTAIDWLNNVLSYDTANSVGIGHVPTAIVWDNIYLASGVDNSIGIASVISGISYYEAYTYGNNEFVNPGFEDGINNYSIHDSSNGFYGTISATSAAGEVHSGTYAAKLISGTTDESNITRISQDCATIPGEKYMLSFWYRGDGVTYPHFFVYGRNTAINITPTPVVLSSSTDWQQYHFVIDVPAAEYLIRSVFYAPFVVGGTVWYDDLSFSKMTLITLPDLGLNTLLNSASINHMPTAIDWETVNNQIFANENINAASLSHAPTAIDWDIEPENLLANADFELDLQWWSKQDSSNGTYGNVAIATGANEYHGGAKAVKLTAGTTNYAEYPIIYQGADVVSGKQYLLTGWSRGDGTNAGTIYVYNYTQGTGITPDSISTGNVSTTWQKFTYAFTATGNDQIRVYFGGPNAASSYAYFDDLWLYEGTLQTILANENANSVGVSLLPTAVDWETVQTNISANENANSVGLTHVPTAIDWTVTYPNLWDGYNPAFESDFANWVKNDTTNGNHGTAAISTAAGEYYSGTKAAKLTADASTYYDTNPWLHRDTILQPSTNYRLSFWTRGDGTHAAKFFIHDKTTNTYITPSDVSTGITSTTWQKVTYDFTTPAGASNVRVYLENPGTVGSVVYFDECSLSLR